MEKNFFKPRQAANTSTAQSFNIEKISTSDIAVIGMAGVMPDSGDLGEFWKKVAGGTDCVVDFPVDRAAEAVKYLKWKTLIQDDTEVKFKRKGYLREVDKFDYRFFNFTAKEGEMMNPAQRIFLEVAYHSIEHAGYSCLKLKSSNIGIYLGYTGGSKDYLNFVSEAEPEFAAMAYPANMPSIIASRLSYLFDFKGPSILFDTACSSSMVAFYSACQSLRNGDCDMAIAGGINLSWMPVEEGTAGLGILSASSKTKTFDYTSDGTVGGEGCAAVLLKPLNKALRDNDNILAVVKGVACNQDGNSIGITAPNALAQADVIEKAWKDGNIQPESIGYIEAHGTATALGDPIEIEGITHAFKKYTDRRQFCAIGSVKSNIGHLNSAAGIAGIIKAILSLKNQQIPPSLHFERPNDKINFEESPVFVNTRLINWLAGDTPRRCGVSSFGMSGTNSHVILEEAPEISLKINPEIPLLFALSARNKGVLLNLVKAYSKYIEQLPPETQLANICFTATAGRDHHEHRIVFQTSSLTDFHQKIKELEASDDWYTLAAKGILYNSLEKNKEFQTHNRQNNNRLNAINAGNANHSTRDQQQALFAIRYLNGEPVDWAELYQGIAVRRVEIPLYPFERKRCWVTCPDAENNFPVDKNDYAAKSQPVETTSNITCSPQPQKNDNMTLLEILNVQLQVMSRQLEMVAATTAVNADKPAPHDGITVNEVIPAVVGEPVATPVSVKPGIAYQQAMQPREEGLSQGQKQYVQQLIKSFNAKTSTSKQLIQQQRVNYANNRLVAGYTNTYKEMMYPILIDEAKGAHITDVDGNKYIDFCMGFGVYLLGYTHPEVSKAVAQQLDKGVYLGPMSPLAGEVAQLVCEMTGVDRVAFYNSGTEAVMLALRLARAATSKTKIVMFSGSYHGTYDGVLAQPDKFSKEHKAVPKSTGIAQSVLDEVILLDYGTPESLEIIKKHAHELAAVLVEPVQSRRPEFQPKEYLLELRAITEELKVPLIFDEIITGFRIHPGGAQAWFGIKADLVTYGKIPGGGLPIGIIGGKAEFMHGVDGGMWQFGDDSQPKFDHRKTFVAGTFCHHPLSMAAAKAALLHLKTNGGALQHDLNCKTAAMAAELNAFFKQEKFNVKIVNFGSLFQVRTNYDLSLIVYHFLNNGIYAWEGMTFFISTAHTEADITYLIKAFKDTLRLLRYEGFIPTPDNPDEINIAQTDRNLPLTEEQRRLWFAAKADKAASVAFHSVRVIAVDEKLNEKAFSKAIDRLINRHEILRTIRIDGDQLYINDAFKYQVGYLNVAGEAQSSQRVEEIKHQVFDFDNGPFFRIKVIKRNDDQFSVIVVVHHIIADGWSINIILEEIAALYEAYSKNEEPALALPVNFGDYINWTDNVYNSAKSGDSRTYWIKQLSNDVPKVNIPEEVVKTESAFKGCSYVFKMSEELTTQLTALAKKEKCTLFMVTLSLYILFLNKISGSKKQLLGIPSSGQLNMEADSLVGCCVQMLPLYSDIDTSQSFSDFLADVRNKWLDLYKHRNFPYPNLTRDGLSDTPAINFAFNMDAPLSIRIDDQSGDGRDRIYKKEGETNKYKLFLNVIKMADRLKFTFQFNSSIFDEELMTQWIQGFENITEKAVADPKASLADFYPVITEVYSISAFKNATRVLNKNVNTFWNNRNDEVVNSPVWIHNGVVISLNQLRQKVCNVAHNIKNRIPNENGIVGIALSNFEEMICCVLGLKQAGLNYRFFSSGEIEDNDSQLTDEVITAIVTHVASQGAKIKGVNSIDYKKLIANNFFRLDCRRFEPLNATMLEDKATYYQDLVKAFKLSKIGCLRLISQGLAPDLLCDIALLALFTGKKVDIYTDVESAIKNNFDTKSCAWVLHKDIFSQWLKTSNRHLANNLLVIGESPLLGEHVRQWAGLSGKFNLHYAYYSNAIGRLVTGFKVTASQQNQPVLSIGELLSTAGFNILDDNLKPVMTGVFGILYKIEAENNIFTPVVYNCRSRKNRSLEINYAAGDNSGKIVRHAILKDLISTGDHVDDVFFMGEDSSFTAYVSFINDKNSNLYNLQKHLKSYFKPEYLPARIINTKDKLPDTPQTAAVEIADEFEQKLLTIFRAVLNNNGVDINDDFFEYGGNSLRAIQVASRIYQALHVRVQLRKIFNNPTVKTLADNIRNDEKRVYHNIVPVAIGKNYELSHAQKRMWILDQVEKGQVAYLITKSLIIDGDFNSKAFERAVEELFKRHESLRTNFITIGGEPVQQINPYTAERYTIDLTDLTKLTDKEEALKQIIDTETKSPMNLSADALFRVKVVQLTTKKIVLLMTIHHIIADGWSMEILINDLTVFYNAFKNNEPNPLPSLAIQYKDFVDWQNNRFEEAELQNNRAYWLSRFEKGIPVLDLPTDFPRPAKRRLVGGRVPFTWNKDLSAKIFAISRSFHTSIFTTLLTFTKLLLHKYSGQTDIIIGSTTAGREHPELEKQIGLFANTLMFKTEFDAGDSFSEFLLNVKNVTFDAYEHQNYPFNKIVEDLNVPRDTSRSPLFDVMIELDDVDIEFTTGGDVEELQLAYYEPETAASKYDLTFRFNAGDTVFGCVEFSSDLFNRDTVERLIAGFAQLVEEVDADINKPIATLGMLSPKDKQQLLSGFNNTAAAVDWNNSVQQRFENTAKIFAGQTAIQFGNVQLSYQQLNDRANALAAHLQNQYNIGVGDKVAIIAERSELIPVALMGILKSGAAFVPVDPETPEERRNYILNNAGIRLVLTDTNFMFQFADNDHLQLFVMDIELDGLPSIIGDVPEAGSSDNIAYLIYTSGSTGMPKGVEVRRRNLLNYLNWANHYYCNNKSGKTFAYFTSLAFDLTITSIFTTLLRGDKIAVSNKKNVSETLKDIFSTTSDVDLVKLTPSHIRLLGTLGLNETKVSQVIVGGEALTREQILILRNLNNNIKIYNEYGPTEATVGCITKEIGFANKPVLIGKPIDNTQIYILDEQLRLAPQGVPGEIYIGGASVARGYAGDEELTKQRFISNPFNANEVIYKTGDIGRWNTAGEIEYLGRNDDQVKINGHRIELREVESILLGFELIAQAIIEPVRDPEGSLLLAAYYVSTANLTISDLLKHLQQRLPQYMLPSFFIAIDSIPVTANGKVDKKALPNPFTDRNHPLRTYVAPVTNNQKKLIKIWERVLGINGIGIRDNFFELGGHSLKATQILSDIFKEFAVNLQLDEIFNNTTIEKLVQCLDTTEQTLYYDIAPVEERSYYEPSYGQERIWVLNLLEDNQTAYVIPDAFVFDGALDVDAFSKAFKVLVQRHESLRTSFALFEGEPKQCIHPAEDFTFTIEYTDLINNSAAWEIIGNEVLRERNQPFDLEKGPLIRARLFRMQPQKHVFLLTLHHIVSDGWSFEVLVSEVSKLYDAFAQGYENPLQPLKIQYKDYANWYQQQLSGQRLDEHRNFWLKYLDGYAETLEIPADYHRKPQRTYNGGTVKFALDQQLTEKIKKFGQQHSASAFMTLSAVINILIYRHTRAKDVAIGFPIAGRGHADLENQIGLYLNTLALRVQFEKEDTIDMLIEKVKRSTLDVYKYQLYSFNRIISDLDIERKPNRSPIFDIGITWQNQMEMNISAQTDFKGLKISQLEEECTIAKHDLWFYGSELNECFGFRLRYNTDLYKKETIERVRNDFVKICEIMTEDPGISIADIVSELTCNNNLIEAITAINSNLSEDF
ncbi:amino acid adenylation domain-containing protein [Mucilaginibacter sp. 21P]|nr:amino acid adenylation domain-containing protein [Mucilaginibacter sp. 21P]